MKCSVFAIVALLCLQMILVEGGYFNLSVVLNKIPDDERLEFVKYHVNRGFGKKHSYNPGYDEGYNDTFSVEMYQYFLETHLIQDPPETMYRQVCFPNGRCVDLDDPGIHPKHS